MTTFLWTVVILMAAALVAEIVAFAGMAIVAMRAARRGADLAEQVKQKIGPAVKEANELRASVQTHLDTLATERKQMAELVSNRSQLLQATIDDASRRAERIRLRLLEGVGTVEGEKTGRRGIYREEGLPRQLAQ